MLWVFSITLLGYFLGAAFPALGENIDYAVIAILAFSVIPVAYEWLEAPPRTATAARRRPPAPTPAAEADRAAAAQPAS